MEHKIGTKITLEVVESDKGCEECYFGAFCGFSGDCPFECEFNNRSDHKDVIYKEIKEETK